MGHDVTRLGAAAVKRRYPPGMVPGQESEEITLVQSDIEGSTEIWEWFVTPPLVFAALLLKAISDSSYTSLHCVHLLQMFQLAAACSTLLLNLHDLLQQQCNIRQRNAFLIHHLGCTDLGHAIL